MWCHRSSQIFHRAEIACNNVRKVCNKLNRTSRLSGSCDHYLALAGAARRNESISTHRNYTRFDISMKINCDMWRQHINTPSSGRVALRSAPRWQAIYLARRQILHPSRLASLPKPKVRETAPWLPALPVPRCCSSRRAKDETWASGIPQLRSRRSVRRHYQICRTSSSQ